MTEGNVSQDFMDLTANIVSAYVSNNSIQKEDVPTLIDSVHNALIRVKNPSVSQDAEAPRPAVSIKKSIQPDYIICLEDGKKFKSLRRHLNNMYNLTPDEYRAKWGLPRDYPMVAPNYAKQRSQLAKRMGLGQGRKAAPPPAPAKGKAGRKPRSANAA
jgi:predicted transcriptional regulator